jgi:hypothetical protein
MNHSDHELDPFTEALKHDLPNEADEARVRRRLVSAGVLAGASAVVPGAAAAAASSGGGLLAKVASLPLALKVGASVVALGVATVPVYERVASSGHDGAKPAGTALATLAAAPARVPSDEGRLDQPRGEVGLGAADPVLPAKVEPAAPEPLTGRPQAGYAAGSLRGREAVPASAPAPDALPAVGSFPTGDAKPIDEGTLRAETILMERALAAIQRGDLVGARRELAAHAAKFPDGHLKPERERALARTLSKESEP